MNSTSPPHNAANDPIELSNDALVRRSRVRSAGLLEREDELRRVVHSPEAQAKIQRAKTSIEAAATAFEVYADRPCLGYRALDRGSLEPQFRTLSYAEVWARIETFASGIMHARLAKTGELLGISGFAGVDWVVADLACHYLGITAVPIQTRMVPADLQQIIRETELGCIVCSALELDSIEAALPQCPSVWSLVVMDLREGDRAAAAQFARRKRAIEEQLGGRVIVRTMREVEAMGRDQGIVPKVLPSRGSDVDPLMTLIYTSGSTGTPKGAMYRESLWIKHWQTGFSGFFDGDVLEVPFVTVNYMPLNHGAGIMQLLNTIARGGTTYFVSKSDMSTLFEDIRLARPTSLLLVPRIATMIHQRFLAELVRRSAKVDSAHEDEKGQIERDLLVEMRESFLGDRLLYAFTASAPTPPEVVSFLKRCFQIPVFDGYGSTEAGPITIENRVDPALGITWRLVDVPELGYRTTDAPYPRGELHVRSSFLIPGYYKNERATKDLFDEEGFMNTGDIVEQRGPDSLVWIDRAKNVLKLSQGEYVATSRLEGLYVSRSPFIQQMYVYGNGLQSYLLAVVVPDVDAISVHVGSKPGDEVDEATIKQLVRSEINRIAAGEGLHGYEIPREIVVERAPFTTENGLLTASSKPSRPKLRARYGERLEALYASIEQAQVTELARLRSDRVSALSTIDKVKKAVVATLGLADLDLGQAGQSFVQLGGDSLSAVNLGNLLEEMTGIDVPVGLLLDPTSSVRAVARTIDDALGGTSPHENATFNEIHGAGSKIVRASDLALAKFLSAEEIAAAAGARPASELPPEAKVVLLTGANGFLGRFLTLELLQRWPEGGRLHCIVRASDDAAAMSRLRAAFREDPVLAKRFEKLMGSGRLAVHAGDLMKRRLGLASDVYARLAEEVDCVLHNGALVNHAFTYRQLFEPNVLGTIEIIRFAFARRIKSVSYVSSIGAVLGLDRDDPIGEDEDIRSLWPERAPDLGYAAGYATSKWASEILLRHAHDELGIPVAVFRPSGIMGHRELRGQINVPDFFTRLLAGIIYTGIAPRSFYLGGPRHYDGLPVDVVARSIAAVSAARERIYEPGHGYATYNVVNAYWDDGISLDTIVDWMTLQGYRIDRDADYADWYRTFRDRLSSLGEAQKQHSPLPILAAWEHPQREGMGVMLDNARLVEELAAIGKARGPEDLAVLPHVDQRAIDKYLHDMIALRIIAPPPLRMTGS